MSATAHPSDGYKECDDGDDVDLPELALVGGGEDGGDEGEVFGEARGAAHAGGEEPGAQRLSDEHDGGGGEQPPSQRCELAWLGG